MNWVPDVIEGFEQLTLELTPMMKRPVVATLVRRNTALPLANLSSTFPKSAPESALFSTRSEVADAGADVLYLHGWVDYFHQTHLAAYFESLGIRFYALDLRKYGRSIRDWQTPGYADTLRIYDEDIRTALAAIGHYVPQTEDSASLADSEPLETSPSSEVVDSSNIPDANSRKLVLMGHSTGGLIAALWAQHNPSVVDALILNSPWLEFQTGNLGRRALEGPIRAQARIAPMSHLVNPDPGYYVKSISNRYDGEWEINHDWKPVVMWPPTAAWMSAIFRGQDRISAGLDLEMPVLVLLSAKSTLPIRWTPELLSSDQVITVDDVMARAPSLGRVVTVARFEGALHDVTLSAAEVRAQLWPELTRWLGAYL